MSKLKDKVQQLEKERSDLLLEKIWLTKLQVSKVYELNKEIARLKRRIKNFQGVDVSCRERMREWGERGEWVDG